MFHGQACRLPFRWPPARARRARVRGLHAGARTFSSWTAAAPDPLRYEAWNPHWQANADPPLNPPTISVSCHDDGKWLVTFDSPAETGPRVISKSGCRRQKPVGKPVVATNGLAAFFSSNRILNTGREKRTYAICRR